LPCGRMRELRLLSRCGRLPRRDRPADFIERIVRPVASRFDYQIDATEAHQNLEDWTSADAARKLRVFSTAANKSTGASHPTDQRRWFDFIIAVRSLLPLSSNATVDLH
jgi:hypothetical protein